MDSSSDVLLQGQQAICMHEVVSHLQANTLSCKWFYDATGSILFEQITETPEYYPTRVEARLLQQLSANLVDYLPELTLIVEPGSGSSNKTRILLGSQPRLAEYIPMDISAQFLHENAQTLRADFPHLRISPLVCDFTKLDQPLPLDGHEQALIFFPGSTIGNFNPQEAVRLLDNIRVMAGDNSWLLLGVDMTQDADKLLAAYDDAAGITARFNKNILHRINVELGADFVLDGFEHRAVFNAEAHRIEMHLVSTRQQTVALAGHKFEFEAGEFIHTENSHKYPRAKFEALLQQAGWLTQHVWQDQEESGFGVFLLRSQA